MSSQLTWHPGQVAQPDPSALFRPTSYPPLPTVSSSLSSILPYPDGGPPHFIDVPSLAARDLVSHAPSSQAAAFKQSQPRTARDHRSQKLSSSSNPSPQHSSLVRLSPFTRTPRSERSNLLVHQAPPSHDSHLVHSSPAAVISPRPMEDKKFLCGECDMTFTRDHDRKRHVETRHRYQNIHHCPKCGKDFSRRDAVQRHVKVCLRRGS
jgi:uncharacterized C2H2 Zn-finger protein